MKTDCDGMIIQETKQFQRSRAGLPPAIQRTLLSKLALLEYNPAHPSLRSHRVMRAQETVWEIWVSYHYRLLYRRQDEVITLLDVGNHVIVDRVHLRKL